MPASFAPRGRGHYLPHHHHQTDVKASFNDSDFDLDIDSLVIEKMPRNASPRRKLKFIEKLFSAFHPKKSASMDKKHGKQRRVRFEDETSHQRRRVKREKSKMEERDSMVEDDVRRISTISRHDTNPHRSSNIGASSAISNSKRAREKVDEKIEGWESDSSVLSSRDSEVNLGSIMGQPATPDSALLSHESLPQPQGLQEFQPSPPKSNPSWSDSRSQSRSSAHAQTSQGTATSSSTSRHVNTLSPSFTSIVPPVYTTYKPSESDFDQNRARRRAERSAVTPVLPPKTANSVHGKEPDRRVASPVARDLRARRAERTSETSAAEKYHRDERERLWSSQKA
ncbi:hypothetical protein DL98DRAFT_509657 [Cadophora sp. DSE1049]|nr:hypothetical protein DL98DRAFT_509657 [Cadophora sp. DSE1049]